MINHQLRHCLKQKNQKKAQKIIQSIKSTTLDEISTQNNIEVQTALSVKDE